MTFSKNIAYCRIFFYNKFYNRTLFLRPNIATFNRDWFTQNHVTVMEWPSALPDLNLMENVWQIRKLC